MRTAFGENFDVPDGYLNSASVGIPPVRVTEAVLESVRRWGSGRYSPPEFDAPVATARAAFADLVGVGADRVAIGAAVSQLLGPIAAAVPDGASVVVAQGEFTSVSFPFAMQAGRGVTVTEVPPDRLVERAAEADVVAVSVVQSADGRIADLDGLREVQQRHGTLVVLDVTQAAGWLPLSLAWADVVAGGGYKWLLAPRGTAWMALRPEVEAVPHLAGWYASEDPWKGVYGLPPNLAPDARAFDVSPAWTCQVGAAGTLPWLAGLDMAAVHSHCAGLADALRMAVGTAPTGSAIVSVGAPGAIDRLTAAGVTASARAGGARLAFGLYNTADDLDRAVDALARA
ncbi:aminotransferase class V-fold PLP-dependent enzyme [Pseudonocardia sp.]|uniref:aminotransferase class V-fold PLP-dependent enzyme n=1 Tax=Pseudonocardia sp. TaxID=60912 RepID=UPI003D144A29